MGLSKKETISAAVFSIFIGVLFLPGINLKNIILKLQEPSTLLVVTSVLVGCLALASYACMTLTAKARLLNRFPGVRILPFLGTIWAFKREHVEFTKTLSNQVKLRGRRLRGWVLHNPVIMLAEAKAIEKVLGSSAHLDKATGYQLIKWLLGNGLVTSDVHVWKEDRKLLNPSFKYQKFDGFLNTFNKQSEILVKILREEFPVFVKDSKEVHEILCRCTMDSISEAALKMDLSCQLNPDDDFMKATRIALQSIQTRILKPYLVIPILWDIFGMGKEEAWCMEMSRNAINKATNARREELLKMPEGQEDVTKPFVDILLESRSQSDIFDHSMTIFGAGFETTASALNFTLFLLALNLTCQVKVQEELDRVFGPDKKELSIGNVADLKYLEMCIKESMRIYPPVPFIGRLSQADIELDDGLVIPKGVDISILIYELHRDPSVFEDPERFDPERFLPERCATRSPYAYAPFSLGPRICIGQKYAMMQMKVILAHILRNFTIKTRMRREDLELLYGIVSATTQPIKLILEPRKPDQNDTDKQ